MWMQIACSALFAFIVFGDGRVSAQVVPKRQVSHGVGRTNLKEVELHQTISSHV